MSTGIEVKNYKLKALPNKPIPNAILYIKADGDSAISTYITDVNGIPYPLKDDAPSGGVQSIFNTDGTISVIGTTDVKVSIQSSILNTINSALQPGDLPNTKAEFNSQLSDGNFLFVGDVIPYTDEEAQDAVGNIFTDTNTISITYDDLTPSISVDVKPNSITPTELADNINLTEFINNAGFENTSQLNTRDTNNRNRVNHTGTQTISTVVNLQNSLDEKLDKDGYIGTAQTLSDAIDAIFVPDQLISGVAPTRSVNTFTYPALGYTALISKTLRTNPSSFVTTISAASTTNHKRVDLIYFKPDNTLAKLIGTEDLIIAPIPDVPNGSVGVSFINVFGNVIDTPTPITEEISIQDYGGVERFRITNYLRFKGVSFDSTAKALITDPLVPLSAFLDATNGDDITGTVENSNKPFKTIQALLISLPPTAGETYTIYIASGNVSFTRKVQPRNLRWVAYTTTNLDFTNVLEDDGITNAKNVYKENVSNVFTWTFENENISLISNYVGEKSLQNNTLGIALKGTLNFIDWRSTREASYAGAIRLPLGTDLKILSLYDSPQETLIFQTNPNDKIKIKIQSWFIQYSRGLFYHYGNEIDLEIDNITQLGSTPVNAIISSGQYKVPSMSVKNINIELGFYPFAKDITFNGNILGGCNVIFDGSDIVRGTIISDNYHTRSYHIRPTYFKDFTCKIAEIGLGEQGQLTFENCNIETNTWLAGRVTGHDIENCIHFTGGANTLKQINTSVNLFNTFTSPTAGFKPIMIDLVKLNTNALSYGVGTNYIQTQSTFKERLNELVVRSKVDLVNKVLSSTVTYVIDANLVLLTGEYIQVPIGGLTLAGYGFDVSSISKNVTGESIFISPVGNSGNFVTRDVMYSPGLGSVFNLTDSNGTHAIEFNDVNFQGVTGSSLGILNGYRQFTGTTCGFYGLSDGLTLEGIWSGFKLTNSNVIGFGASGTLFKKGTTTSFTNRFYIDLNIQIATGSKICDFAEVNLVNNKSLQVVNCYNKVNGIIDPSTTAITFPNITPFSAKSYFVNNIGITNSRYVIENGVASNEAVAVGQLSDTILSSASTLTLSNSSRVMYYTYTGSAPATWTIPPISGNSKLRLVMYNTGTGVVTINTNTGGDDIYDSSSLVNTSILNPGTRIELFNNSAIYIMS